jgi:hypothetical protein
MGLQTCGQSHVHNCAAIMLEKVGDFRLHTVESAGEIYLPAQGGSKYLLMQQARP